MYVLYVFNLFFGGVRGERQRVYLFSMSKVDMIYVGGSEVLSYNMRERAQNVVRRSIVGRQPWLVVVDNGTLTYFNTLYGVGTNQLVQ